MKKFLVLGDYEPFIVEAENWESAFWKALDSLKENIALITALPTVE